MTLDNKPLDLPQECAHEDPLVTAVEAYLASIEVGEPIEIDQFVRRYPELHDLRDCLEALDVVSQVAPDVAGQATGSNVSPPIGSKFGEFRILREIGRGGMGVVYEAEQQSLGRLVALKMLAVGAVFDQKAITRFRNEARAAATLDHPNIVPVIAVGSERGRYYFAMSLIQGLSLSEIISQLKNSSPNQPNSSTMDARMARDADESTEDPALRCEVDPVRRDRIISHSDTHRIVQAAISTYRSRFRTKCFKPIAELGASAADALDHAHQRGIVHRDIKPSNLMLDLEGKLWVTDFGLALMETDSRVTMSGDFVGTLRYMPPEQALAKRSLIDHRADIYSLGATLYELLALRAPFEAEDRHDLLQRIARDTPKPVRHYNEAVPRDLETIVMKAISRQPEDRYASAEDMAQDLRAFMDRSPISAKPPSIFDRAVRWSVRHKGVVLSLVTILMFAAVGLSVSTALIARERSAAESTADRLRHHVYASRMRLASQSAAEAGGMATVRELLAKTKPEVLGEELRGWEWHYLNSMGRREQITLVGHGDAVLAVAWSPDKKQILSSSANGNLRTWNAETGKPILNLVGHLGAIHDATWSPSGKLIATAGTDRTVRIWDAASGNENRTLMGHSNVIRTVRWSPDGKQLASAGDDKTIRIWDVGSGVEVDVQRESERPILAVAWNHDGTRIASAGKGGTIMIWNRLGDAGPVALGEPSRYGISSVDWSPDGQRLASASESGEAKIWDVDSGEELIATMTCPLNSLQWSPDGSQVAGVGRDGTVKVWDPKNESAVILRGHTDEIKAVCWSPDGKRIASAGFDQTVKIWRVRETDPLPIGAHEDLTYSARVSPNGLLIASAGADRVIRIWDASSGRRIRELVGHEDVIYSLSWSRDGAKLASGSRDQTIRIWDPVNGLETASLHCNGSVLSVDWNPDGLQLASTSNTDTFGFASVWDVSTERRKLLKRLKGTKFESIRWGREGTRLAFAGSDGLVRIWDHERGLSSLRGHLRRVRCVDWSPDGQRLASGGADRTIRIWDIDSMAEVFTLRGNSSHVRAIAWHPDGERLASVTGFIKLWDPDTGIHIATLGGVFPDWQRGFRDVAWSTDGKRLIFTHRHLLSAFDANTYDHRESSRD